VNRLLSCCWLGVAVFCGGISIIPARGAVFERDWMTPGDGLLTYDTVHRREWLDLSVSRIDQFPVPRLQNAIAQLEPGGLFDGFTWAKSRAVRQLAVSGGIDISTTDVAINGVPTNAMIDLLSPTIDFQSIRRSIGFINEKQTISTAPPFNAAAFHSQSRNAGLFIYLSIDELNTISNGLMLYRPVPEPASMLLAALGIFALISNRARIA
jgi:hypothetical protein